MNKEKLEEICAWKEIMVRQKAKNNNTNIYECDDCLGYDLKCPAYGVIGK